MNPSERELKILNSDHYVLDAGHVRHSVEGGAVDDDDDDVDDNDNDDDDGDNR